ncbi:hypothetical protein BDFG_03096 [Blastomyces dermatitidis ATCC 26199]|nr:hypothetical protein BDFG_03096 [Blastomyces dermatitidis ATCC 26199]
MLLIGRKHKNAALQQLCKARYHSTNDLGGLAASQSLLERWAAIGSASSLPRSIRPRVIIVTRGGAVMGNILEENQFIDNLFRPESTSRLLSSFADVRLSHLQPAELSPEAQYLDLQGDMMEELHAARRVEQFEGSEDEFMIKKCLPCKELTCLKVRVKPSTAGVRIISIDEEGIHVIMPLNVLEMMQAYIPHLPLHYLVDFWGGTSTEGNVALNMRGINMLKSRVMMIRLSGRFNIPRVGSLQNGGTHPHNNNPVHMALSEAQHLWPTTKPDVVISLGAPPAMNDADATESMSQWVRKQPRKRIEEALILLLVSCFYFILDAVPDFHSGLFYCVGSLQCRAPPRPIIQALLSLRPTTLCFYKDSLNLGFCLAEEDICESCQRYCRPVRFCVRDLKETVTLALCRDDAIHEVSMFPNTIQWFIDQQDLESNFGLENHGISFHIQCTAAFYRPAILMLMILKTMNEPTGTIATMHDKAQHGNLANVTDFVVNFLHENLRRIAPSAGIQQEVKTAFQPPRTSQALFITLGGSIVVFGRVSATQDINELRNTLVEEVTQKAVAQGGRRKGFAFATSRGGGLKCQFFEVRGAADFDPIPNEPLDFDADEARIVAILEHCLEYFNV